MNFVFKYLSSELLSNTKRVNTKMNNRFDIFSPNTISPKEMQEFIDGLIEYFPAGQPFLRQDLVLNNSEKYPGVTQAFIGHTWFTLPEQIIDSYSWVLPLFKPISYSHFLPAYLLRALSRDHLKWAELSDKIISDLSPEKNSKWSSRFCLFNRPQRTILARWLTLTLGYDPIAQIKADRDNSSPMYYLYPYRYEDRVPI